MTVWFNHWFSTAYHLINMMRDGLSEGCKFIGSGTANISVFRTACDEWYSEPTGISDEEYAQYCLDFCREHKVDVFVPRRGLVAIVKRAADFEAAGVKLFADKRTDIMDILDDKLLTYELLGTNYPEYIPETYVAHSLEEFRAAYDKLSKCYDRVCYKLTIDEGARSFRVIDSRIETIKALYEKPGSKITYSAACAVLAEYDFSIPMLVMPYLDGWEISCDCLATPQGNLIIPRYKTGKRYSIVKLDKEIMDVCSSIMDELQLKMPMNIQFKCYRDQPKLLEINPRMSGGLQLSCKATGINLPAIALNQLLGVDTPWQYPDIVEQKVAHIETPICLKGEANSYTADNVLRLAKRYNNAKRSYLLVNPLQAKHMAVSPTKALDMMYTLGDRLHEKYPSAKLVIGFAETATAIAAAAAERIPRCKYIHTTREPMPQIADWLYFSEEHSHAVEQKICTLKLPEFAAQTDTIILIDDEISTGKTLINIVERLRTIPEIGDKRIVAASIINRVNDENMARLAAAGIECECLVKLPEEDYTSAVGHFEVRGAERIEGDFCNNDSQCRLKTLDPRIGVDMAEYAELCRDNAKKMVSVLKGSYDKVTDAVVLGTEECMYPALIIAYKMEKSRCFGGVTCRSTTRSPIGIGNDAGYPVTDGYKIRSCYDDGRETYIYNPEKTGLLIIVTDGGNLNGIGDLDAVFSKHGCDSRECVFLEVEE